MNPATAALYRQIINLLKGVLRLWEEAIDRECPQLKKKERP